MTRKCDFHNPWALYVHNVILTFIRRRSNIMDVV